jgi:UDP-N-acetylmuramate-alanine ligase
VADAARRAKGGNGITYVSEKKAVVECLERTLVPGDLLVTLGAGDVVLFGEEYLKRAR